MFGIGGFELFIILVFGFLIFGPDKLPEVAKTVGKGIARFRQAQEEMNETLGGEKIFDPNNPEEPFKNPVEVLDRMAQRQEEKKRGAVAGKPEGANQKAGAEGSSDAKDDVPGSGDAKDAANPGSEAAPQETFTQRKERYQRERAARKAAEAQAANGESSAAPSSVKDAPGTAASKGGE